MPKELIEVDGPWAIELRCPTCEDPYLRMCNGEEAVEIYGDTYPPIPFEVDGLENAELGVRLRIPNVLSPCLFNQHDRIKLFCRRTDGTLYEGEAEIDRMVLNWISTIPAAELLIYVKPAPESAPPRSGLERPGWYG